MRDEFGVVDADRSFSGQRTPPAETSELENLFTQIGQIIERRTLMNVHQ